MRPLSGEMSEDFDDEMGKFLLDALDCSHSQVSGSFYSNEQEHNTFLDSLCEDLDVENTS